MLRMILVTICFGVGAVWGLQSVLGAGVMLVWNDIFRPTAWARYHGFLHWSEFPSHHFCYAILLFAVFFTRWKKRWNIASTSILILLGWTWIAATKAEFTVPAYEKALEATKYFVPAVIMSIALVSRRYQQIFLYVLALSVGIYMTHYGLMTLLRQGPETQMNIRAGQMTDRNDFLVAGTACLPLMIYMAWHYSGIFQRWGRFAMKGMALLSLIPFFTSLSRGAVVGLAAMIAFYALGTGRMGRRIMIALLIVAVTLPLVPGFVWDRMSTIEFSEEQVEMSAANRLLIAKVAVDVTLDYPLFGVGPRNFPYVAARYNRLAIEPHSLWLKCSTEYGLPLFIFFVVLMITILRRLRRVAKTARAQGVKETEGLATALSCSIFGFLATGSFTSQFMSEYLWNLIALAGAFLARIAVEAEIESAPTGEIPASAASMETLAATTTDGSA